jgi:hypothetical protein
MVAAAPAVTSSVVFSSVAASIAISRSWALFILDKLPFTLRFFKSAMSAARETIVYWQQHYMNRAALFNNKHSPHCWHERHTSLPERWLYGTAAVSVFVRCGAAMHIMMHIPVYSISATRSEARESEAEICPTRHRQTAPQAVHRRPRYRTAVASSTPSIRYESSYSYGTTGTVDLDSTGTVYCCEILLATRVLRILTHAHVHVRTVPV